MNEKIKSTNTRQTNKVSSKVNSWGKILKDQNNPGKDQNNPVKDKKRLNPQTLPTKQKSFVRNQVKDKAPNENIVNNQTKPVKNQEKPAIKQIFSPVAKKKSSHQIIKVESPNKPVSEYDSGSSATSITGESIMLVDRSVQCSATNLELKNEQNNLFGYADDFNDVGDGGLAFLNPVRTLNFLVRELRGKLSEGLENENTSRIIRDMENNIALLTNTPQGNMQNWKSIISEEDLKFVLKILQNAPPQISDAEKNTDELQVKLEGTCSKLEELCKNMEKTISQKLKDDKQKLISELQSKTDEIESLTCKERQNQLIIDDLRNKYEDLTKQIMALKENHSKAVALNNVLNEQLIDTEKKYKQVMTENKFLILEKEKNNILMKCKDKDIQDMKYKLEEIKSFVIHHISSFQIDSNNQIPPKDDEKEFDFESTIHTTLSTTVVPKKNNDLKSKHELPICSSPVGNSSPAPYEDDSWRKISNVPLSSESSFHSEMVYSISKSEMPQLRIPSKNNKDPATKNVDIKESLKNLLEDMKKQAKLGKGEFNQNLISLEEPSGITNWSNVNFSDDCDVASMPGYAISETDTNLSK